MKLLHTSDWHLGQSFHSYDRTFEHERFLSWLVEKLESEEIDVLLVAGDMFDNANPSAASQRLFYSFLREAKRRVPGLRSFFIAGNHDSPGRIEAPSPLLETLDTQVIGQVRRLPGGAIDYGRLVTPLSDRHGDVQAWCLAVPFLRPGDVPRVDAEGDAYGQGVSLLYRQAVEIADAQRQAGQAIVAMGHCHVRGAVVSEESERRIVVGGAEALGSDVFDHRIAYAALGHLHRAQTAGAAEHIRYCGSPLAMAFSELAYPHQVVVVTLGNESVESIRAIPVPRWVRLLRMPDAPAPVDDALDALASLPREDLPEDEWPYLQVRVALTTPEPGLRARVESVLAGRQVRLCRIETVSQAMHGPAALPLSLDELARLDPVAVFRQLHTERFGSEAPQELLFALAEILHEPPEENEEQAGE